MSDIHEIVERMKVRKRYYDTWKTIGCRNPCDPFMKLKEERDTYKSALDDALQTNTVLMKRLMYFEARANKPNCFTPEPNNLYPLCIGRFYPEDFVRNDCKNCCLYVNYELYHSSWEED